MGRYHPVGSPLSELSVFVLLNGNDKDAQGETLQALTQLGVGSISPRLVTLGTLNIGTEPQSAVPASRDVGKLTLP